jgi:N-acetylneuraminic acid mutarotase
MKRGRDNFSTVVVDGKIHTIGGFSPYEEMYDPETDTWVKRASMPTPRQGAAVGIVNGKVYVFGGDEDGTGPTSVVLVYDPEKDTWTKLADMPFAGMSMSASVIDGKVYIIGGCAKEFPCRPPHLSTVWEYLPEH